MTQESAQAPWFAEAQYRALQSETADCLKAQSRLEKFCVGGVVAALVWLAQNSDLYTGPANLVWFLPLLISLYGTLKWNALDVRLRVLGDYLHQIERRQLALAMAAAGGDGGGPEQSWQGYQTGRGSRRRALLGRFAWIAFVALTALASVTGFEGSWPLGDDDGDGEPTAAHVSTSPDT
jgi:hypothetical protein